jgi:foldase protein PrsA
LLKKIKLRVNIVKEDEYIDLDKINMMPKEGELPGFSKPREEEQKMKVEKKTEILPEKDIKNSVPKSAPKKTMIKKKKTNKITKKTRNSSKQEKKQKTSKKPIYALLGLILIAIIVIAIAVTFSGKEDEVNGNKVLLLINNEPLYEEEVKTRADWLRLLNGMPISDEQALELSIETELLYQEAKERNMSIDEEELNIVFENMAMSVQMTNQELQEYIEGFGINFQTLRKVFKKEIMAGELAEKEMYAQELTEEEMKKYYEENKHTFTYAEQARIKHIQINQENNTEEETYEKAESIMLELDEDKSNFCELTKEYSDEWSTKDSCGEYVIETQITHQDELFIQALELEDGEVKIIQTIDGYHVTWREETIPQGTSEYEEVKEIIAARLNAMNAEKNYAQLITNLKSEATIEDYTGLTNERETEPEEEQVIEIDLSDLLNELAENTEEITEEKTENALEDEENVEETTKEEITEEASETETIEENEEITESTELKSTITYKATEETDDAKKLRLAKCLTGNGAKMYSVYWSPHGEAQAKEFGEYFEQIISIECDAEGTNPKLAECKNTLKKQHPTWPTWLINGELHEGYQNLNNLARISGCEY